MSAIKKLDLSNSNLSEDAKTIIDSRKNANNGFDSSVPTLQILETTYGNNLPSPNMSFNSILEELRTITNQKYDEVNAYLTSINEPKIKLPSSSSINNCNCKWSEYCYSAFVWNHLVELNKNNRSFFRQSTRSVYFYQNTKP